MLKTIRVCVADDKKLTIRVNALVEIIETVLGE